MGAKSRFGWEIMSLLPGTVRPVGRTFPDPRPARQSIQDARSWTTNPWSRWRCFLASRKVRSGPNYVGVCRSFGGCPIGVALVVEPL